MNMLSEVTRKKIFNAFFSEKINWSGNIVESGNEGELLFLQRLYNLYDMPSSDRRHDDAYSDIVRHRIDNNDWGDDWVLRDDRFNLMKGSDENLINFLCEILHPAVQTDAAEVERTLQVFNNILSADGIQLYPVSSISGMPVYAGRHLIAELSSAVKFAHKTLSTFDSGYIYKQITRMEMSVDNDPEAAIGAAKELVESCCKTILNERGVEFESNTTMPSLMKLACKSISLTPKDLPESGKDNELLTKLMNNLLSITEGIATLRNRHGSGHGKPAKTKGLQPRHARFVVGAAAALSVFLFETHLDRVLKKSDNQKEIK